MASGQIPLSSFTSPVRHTHKTQMQYVHLFAQTPSTLTLALLCCTILYSDESGMESSTGKGRSRSRAGKGGRRASPGKSGGSGHNLDGSLERSGMFDGAGGGSGGAGAGGLNSRDGRRTWTDAESDRLREVVEHSNGEPGCYKYLHFCCRVVVVDSSVDSPVVVVVGCCCCCCHCCWCRSSTSSHS